MRIIIDDSTTPCQVRFPRSKRRRIRKKWRARRSNFVERLTVPDGKLFQVGYAVIANSRTAAAIQAMEAEIDRDAMLPSAAGGLGWSSSAFGLDPLEGAF